ncbi:hypothetical protein GCM10009784_26980 [Arthrobacter parietis]|uniref:Uncharacterized protein n=1 Tax=Arthrobacter parietis TaxID=271434 RepID=A0ABN3AZF5_9MICC
MMTLGELVPVHLEELALSVARCPEVPKAAADPSHPCHKVVHSQDHYAGPFQVPEAWAGSLGTAKVVFLSSNPSISAAHPEATATYRRLAEKYPTADWDDALIADFMTHRFDSNHSWVNEELRHLKEDCVSRGRPEQYWKWIKEQTEALISDGAPWHQNAVMTEVVHCKSVEEQGVPEAAAHCSSMHMSRILGGTPAGLVVVVGGKARKALLEAYPQLSAEYPRFGMDEANGRPDPSQNILTMTLGGSTRTICYLWHRGASSYGKIVDLATLYPEDFDRLALAANLPSTAS